LRSHTKKTEASTHTGVEWAHVLFVDAYRKLGARTASFDKFCEEVGLRFLGWLQEELESLPSIVTGLMSYASLVTCEGVANALSREGSRYFEVFDRVTEDFNSRIFQVTLQHKHPYSNTYIATKWFMRCNKLGGNGC
jgi:hypothetical protein